jgi:hypothetical protein
MTDRLLPFHTLDLRVARANEARFALLCFRQKLPDMSDSEAALPLLRLTRADEKHMTAVRQTIDAFDGSDAERAELWDRFVRGLPVTADPPHSHTTAGRRFGQLGQ